MARIGKLRENYRGEWATSIAYKIDDIVKYRNGFFRCKTDHTSSTDPVTDIGNTYKNTTTIVCTMRNTPAHTQNPYGGRYRQKNTGKPFYKPRR